MSKKLLIFLLGAMLCVQNEQIKASQPNPLIVLGAYGTWSSYLGLAAGCTLGVYLGNYFGKKLIESSEKPPVPAPKDSDSHDNQSRLKNMIGTLPKELDSFFDMVRNPAHYKQLRVKPPKSLLFYGPPGVGKTEYARAIANELNAEYYEKPGASFKNVWIGQTSVNIQDFFSSIRSIVRDRVKLEKPSNDKYLAVIFLDEIDGIGLDTTGRTHEHQDTQATLTTLLSELSKDNKHILIIAATNHKDKLAPALIRAGRFDAHIEVKLPDLQTRLGILKHYANQYRVTPWEDVSKAVWRFDDVRYERDLNAFVNSNGLIMRRKAKKEAREEVDLKQMSEKTDKFSGADLKELCNKAAMFAAKARRPFVSQKEFDEAFAIMNKEKAENGISEEARASMYT